MTLREQIEVELLTLISGFPGRADVRITAQRVIDLVKEMTPHELHEKCLCHYDFENRFIRCDIHQPKNQERAAQ